MQENRPEVIYKAYEEVELGGHIATVRATYESNNPEDFSKAFTALLDFLEE